MTTEKNKWIDAVGKLLKLTQERRLKWEPHSPPSYLNREPDRKRVDVVYEAQHNDRTLRLFQLSYKIEKPSSLNVLRDLNVYLEGREYPYWENRTVLQLLDQTRSDAWTFPNTEVLDDLLAAVRYQVSGVKEFLDELAAAS